MRTDPVGRRRTDAPTRFGRALLAAVGALYLLNVVTTARTSQLLADRRFIELIALSPRYRNLLLAGPGIAPLGFVIVAWSRLLIADPLFFAVGRIYGGRALAWLRSGEAPRRQRLITSLERAISERHTSGLLLAAFFAGPAVCVLAGAVGFSKRAFFLANAAGTLVVVSALLLISLSARSFVDDVISLNDRFSRVVTVVVAVVVVASVAATARRIATKTTRSR
jgi:membrane protein DedA with SNARE-associated domain